MTPFSRVNSNQQSAVSGQKNSGQQEDVTSPETSLLKETESRWLMANKTGDSHG